MTQRPSHSRKIENNLHSGVWILVAVSAVAFGYDDTQLVLMTGLGFRESRGCRRTFHWAQWAVSFLDPHLIGIFNSANLECGDEGVTRTHVPTGTIDSAVRSRVIVLESKVALTHAHGRRRRRVRRNT